MPAQVQFPRDVPGRSSAAARGALGPIQALVPVRLFFGATFLYAGIDKLLDPRFFDAASPASIQAQMQAFSRVSPIAPLVRLGEPLAVPIGFVIAVAEIAIGLGALTGLAFRLAAAGGAILSFLFFLTASWTTHPFYYGADLPYAIGWLSLAVAGHGGLLVSRRFLDWAGGTTASARRDPAASAAGSRRPGSRRPGPRPENRGLDPDRLPLRDRRTVLQAGVLGVFALVFASLAVPFRRAGAGTPTDDGVPSASGTPSAPGAGSGSGASSSPGRAAIAIAHVADLGASGSRAFVVPFSVPAPLPAGDPGVIVKLADGSFVAFDAICTHAGCTVQWDRADRLLLCPCHGAAFDPAHHAAVVGDGPTSEPLAPLRITVDAATGTISLIA